MPPKLRLWKNTTRKVCMLKLECEVLEEKRHDHQAFLGACSTALWACPLKAHGVLMYPLQLLTGNVPLATMLVITLQLATVGREPPSTASPLTVSRMPAPQLELNGSTACMPRKQEEEEVTGLDVTSKEHPHQRQKGGRPLVRLLRENHW